MRSASFQEKVKAQPDNLLFRFSLGQALVAENRAPEAIEHLEKCAAGRTDWLMPRLFLGQAYLQTGNPASARRWLREALDLAIAQGHEDPEAECRKLLAELGEK